MLIAALLLSAPRLAAAIGLGHPLPAQQRGLHERLELADAVAVATVDAVDVGRIRVRDARAVSGDLPDRFEIKRAPSAPPPLEVGDRALLLLRGARPPYVLADEPKEVTVLGDGAPEDPWRLGLRGLLAADGDADRIASVYLAWIHAPDDDLRLLAGRTLSRSPELVEALSREQVAERVRVAVDPEAPAAARRSSALVALASERGSSALLPRLPGDDALADPEVLHIAFRWGLHHDAGATRALFLRSLSDPRRDVRGVALGLGMAFIQAPEARDAIARVAAHDPDPKLQAAASRLLSRTRQAPARPD